MEEKANMEVSDEQILEWKKEYKKIFRTVLLDGSQIIWRKLKRKEFKDIIRDIELNKDRVEKVYGREENVCKAVILYPGKDEIETMLDEDAGLATLLSDEIYNQSGFLVTKLCEEL